MRSYNEVEYKCWRIKPTRREDLFPELALFVAHTFEILKKTALQRNLNEVEERLLDYSAKLSQKYMDSL